MCIGALCFSSEYPVPWSLRIRCSGPVFRLKGARALTQKAVDLAVARKLRMCIAVTDAYGQLVAFEKMDGPVRAAWTLRSPKRGHRPNSVYRRAASSHEPLRRICHWVSCPEFCPLPVERRSNAVALWSAPSASVGAMSRPRHISQQTRWHPDSDREPYARFGIVAAALSGIQAIGLKAEGGL